MDPIIVGALGLLFLLVFIFLGVPLPVTFFIIGFLGVTWIQGWGHALAVARLFPFTTINSFEWSVIPLFTMMGLILFECLIGEEIFRAVRQWMGHFRGGIAAATSAACAVIGTTTGSATATTALMSKVAYPEMRKYDYEPDLSLAVCAASGTVAVMIPPSVVLVVYAIIAETSVGQCLLGGLLPGFLSMAIYMAMIFIRVQFDPRLGPPQPAASWRERFTSLRYLIPAAIMLVTIVGGIYFGVFTATEAAGMGCVIAFVVVLAMRRLTWSRLKNMIFETARLNIMIMLILMTCMGIYVKFLSISGITAAIAEMALGFPSPWITLTLMFAIMFLFGMFIGGPLMYVTVPMFAPVVVDMGYSLVWFGILMIKMVEVGAITPPVCVTTFVAQGVIGEVPMSRAYKAVSWFVFCDILTLVLLIAFPQITMLLPNAGRPA